MTYFTILHWLVLSIILTLFILVIILVMRNPNEKSPLTTIGVISGLLIMVFIISLYGLDEYTKVARLENITQRRVLSNESFNLSGQIRNIGGSWQFASTVRGRLVIALRKTRVRFAQ